MGMADSHHFPIGVREYSPAIPASNMVAVLVECGLQCVKCVAFSVCVNHKEQESISPESVRKACEFCRLHVEECAAILCLFIARRDSECVDIFAVCVCQLLVELLVIIISANDTYRR